MRSFFKIFFLLIIFSAASYAGYYAYVHWWNGSPGDFVKGSVEGISVRTIESGSKEFVGSITDTAGETASGFMKNIAAGALSSIGNKLNLFASSIVGESASSLKELEETKTNSNSTSSGNSIKSVDSSVSIGQGIFPLETAQGDGFFTPPPFATIILKTNTPFFFSINRAGVSYDVSWGDGERSDGVVPSENFQIVGHSWKKSGDYVTKIDIHEGDAQLYFYSFPVRIYD